MTAPAGERLLVDGHAHLYPCFETAAFLAAARANFAQAAAAMRLPPETPGCLLLTETASEGAFARLRETPLPPPWRAEWPEDEAAVILRDDPLGPPIVVIAGRQIQTAERVEVLAIGTDAPQRDGRPLEDVLDDLDRAGLPAILPWGLGKWLGRRGRLVRAALRARPGMLAGDNAGRPLGWPTPSAFEGHPVLPGTDPLPRPGAEAGVARFGFVLEGPLDRARPATFIRERLRRLAGQPECFGRRATPLRATLDQVRLRLTSRSL